MAATWETTITVTNIAAREVSVRATRTDGEDVWQTSIRARWSAEQTKAQFLQAVGATIWQQREAKIAKAAAIDALVDDCETLLTAGLNAMEVS